MAPPQCGTIDRQRGATTSTLPLPSRSTPKSTERFTSTSRMRWFLRAGCSELAGGAGLVGGGELAAALVGEDLVVDTDPPLVAHLDAALFGPAVHQLRPAGLLVVARDLRLALFEIGHVGLFAL